MRIDELPAQLLAESAKRRETTEVRMFEAGLSFDAITDGLKAIREHDERIAFAIRDALATARLRGMTSEEAFDEIRRAVAACADKEEPS